jgi:hypothetical protein
MPKPATAWPTIWRIDSASPWPRLVSPVSNQVKHELALLAVRCSGSTRAKRHWSANFRHPELVK